MNVETTVKPGTIVFSSQQIAFRVRDLAQEIHRDYGGQPIHLVTVLRGGLIFLADLARELEGTVTMDFMAVTRGSTEALPKLTRDLDAPVAGRHVLLVEDLVNEGRTMEYVMELLRLREPASLKVVSMFVRPCAGQPALDYQGLSLPPDYVVGYGLDYEQRYRNLPDLVRLEGSS